MSLEALLALVSNALNEAGVPYMLTGSLAASYHGAPRATQDIDLVVDGQADQLLSAASSLRDAGLYVSDDAVREAVTTRGMFNAIDPDSGWKVDFIVRKDRLFSRDEFDRRHLISFLGLSISVASPEDTVLAKLEWAKLADSERQLRDVAEILRVQADQLDRARIEQWVAVLGVDDEWVRAQALARESS